MGLKILNIFINTLALAIICLLFFLSLDSFTEHKSLSENLTAFAIHNLPTIFISLICVAGLNKPLIGSFGFTIGASIYMYDDTHIHKRGYRMEISTRYSTVLFSPSSYSLSLSPEMVYSQKKLYEQTY